MANIMCHKMIGITSEIFNKTILSNFKSQFGKKEMIGGDIYITSIGIQKTAMIVYQLAMLKFHVPMLFFCNKLCCAL